MTPEGVDLAIRTIVGEAARQPFAGQQAVANVILNRLRGGRYGNDIASVVFAPHQFEPWSTRKSELMALDASSPAYRQAAQAWQAALQNDVTGGATHFLNPDIVRQRTGGTLPAWAQGQGLTIGQHAFFKPEEGGPPRRAPMPTSAPTSAPAPVARATTPASVGDVFTLPAVSPPPVLTSTRNSEQVPPTLGANAWFFDPAFEMRAGRLPQMADKFARV